MKAIVYHRLNTRFNANMPTMKDLRVVAVVEYERPNLTVSAMLEHCFRHTNHIDHNWALEPEPGVKPDFSFGSSLRSTSVGDVVNIDKEWFLCASLGWEQILPMVHGPFVMAEREDRHA